MGFNGKLDFLTFGISDTCGVFWLHGLPGLFGALAAAWVGSKLYYPAELTPNSNKGNWDTLIKAPWASTASYAIYDTANSAIDFNNGNYWTPNLGTVTEDWTGTTTGTINARDTDNFKP